jgi:acid phosphatase (class A)
MASATVARMHAEAAFGEDMAKARAEVAALRAKGASTTRDCAAEAAALAMGPN